MAFLSIQLICTLAIFLCCSDYATALPALSTNTTEETVSNEKDQVNIAESTNSEVVVRSQAEYGTNKDILSTLKKTLLPQPIKTAESVNLEKEGVGSKFLSLYDNKQKDFVDNTDILPVLDTIQEHEKYGNSGDMFSGFSRAIVNGYEAFSNVLNAIIETPKKLTHTISRTITQQLDILGGKLVGL